MLHWRSLRHILHCTEPENVRGLLEIPYVDWEFLASSVPTGEISEFPIGLCVTRLLHLLIVWYQNIDNFSPMSRLVDGRLDRAVPNSDHMQTWCKNFFYIHWRDLAVTSTGTVMFWLRLGPEAPFGLALGGPGFLRNGRYRSRQKFLKWGT